MRPYNLKENQAFFSTIAQNQIDTGVANQVKRVYPTQLRVGNVISFVYAPTRRAYTAIVAKTHRAPEGRYVTAGTNNSLLTTYLLNQYSTDEAGDFITKVYESDRLQKGEILEYKHWASIIEEMSQATLTKTVNISRLALTTTPNPRYYDPFKISQDFRTFLTNSMGIVEVLI